VNDPLAKTEIADTKVQVTRLGLGGAALGGMYVDTTDEQCQEVVQRALDLGINFFDTAPLYGMGKSEFRIGYALQHVPRDQYVLCSKVGRVLVPDDEYPDLETIWDQPLPFKPEFDFSRAGIMESFHSSLERLQVDSLDIALIHDPDDHYEQAVAEAYPALLELKAQGLVKAIGAGMNQTEMLVRFAAEIDVDVFLLAGRYTLLDQQALDEFFPIVTEKSTSVILGGTYNSGILAGGDTYDYQQASAEIINHVLQLRNLADVFEVDLRAAANQFCLAHPAVSGIIPSTIDPEQVRENLQLCRQVIPDSFWQELRKRDLVHPDAPLPIDEKLQDKYAN